MEIEGGNSRKVEIFFASMLLDINFLSPICRYRGYSRKIECVWVGVMIYRERYSDRERERERDSDRDIEDREKETI